MKQAKKCSLLVLIHHRGKLVNRFIRMEHMVFSTLRKRKVLYFHKTIFESKLYLSPSDDTEGFFESERSRSEMA